ncbi:MAG: hypothetical protein JSR73_09455 [Proteobacteria bacterium]|nr:hypothetical protein [Pseudomonadota bacterium]
MIDVADRAALAGDELRLRHFRLMDRADQETAIRRLRAQGMSPRSIASATKLALEQIELVLASRPQAGLEQ